MLSRVFRFHGHNAVRKAYKNGRSVRNTLGSLHIYQDPNKPRFQMAVVVSKKVHKSAVVRNRIRRRVFEIVRNNRSLIIKDIELVFTVYQVESANIPAKDLTKEVLDLLDRQKLLKKP